MELHMPVMCYTKDYKILIARRSKDRKVYPNCWEFGAAKANGQERMLCTIKREYKEDFNIDLKVMQKDPYILNSNTTLKPFNTYEVFRDGELHKGIVFAALILGSEDEIKITDKHSEYKLIDLRYGTFREELDQLKDDECVPMLKYNILQLADILLRVD